jgi:hypothetical protein
MFEWAEYVEAILGPGECLYILVCLGRSFLMSAWVVAFCEESESISIGVSFWW